MGTARLLQALSSQPQLQALVVITTDKVYDPRQAGPHSEQAFLGGADPYAASKAATELLCGAWPERSLPLVTARAGNVVGGGDWATDRLVPDLVRAWASSRPLILRDPSGVRPWQHVLEPLRGYLLYAEAVMSGRPVSPAMNFGPCAADMVMVADIVSFCASHWPMGKGFPPPKWEATGDRPYGETGVLTIESGLAEHELGWRGLLSWQETMAMTLDWYTGRMGGVPANELVRRDLGAYLGSDGGDAAP
jgi:CDP-glucose 4,6-dehydratase